MPFAGMYGMSLVQIKACTSLLFFPDFTLDSVEMVQCTQHYKPNKRNYRHSQRASLLKVVARKEGKPFRPCNCFGIASILIFMCIQSSIRKEKAKWLCDDKMTLFKKTYCILVREISTSLLHFYTPPKKQ